MKQHRVKIKSIGKITHDVVQIVTEKPPQYAYAPGQATDVAINQAGWETAKRPFTFTGLPTDDHLQFTIKTYPERQGVTNRLLTLQVGDELLLHDVYGAISYHGEGVFIAGGAGVTPFIAILRHLHAQNAIGNNMLICTNKTKGDIILESEFKELLGSNFINILSDEKVAGYAHGQLSAAFLNANKNGTPPLYYVCGPPPMMTAVDAQLKQMHIDKAKIIKESL